MRITAWNIRAGGGRRCADIVRVVAEEAPDVVVFTEFRPLPGVALTGALGDLGFRHHVCGTVRTGSEPKGLNCVCVLGRVPLAPIEGPALPESSHRWVAVEVEDGPVVLAVHVPNQSEIWNKRGFLDCVRQFADTFVGREALIVGDLNTALDEDCQGDPIREAVFLKHLIATGWTDAWRACNPEAAEYTWFSHKANGFRLDHCFASPSMADGLVACRLRHDVRTERISDHSLLTVDFR